jgi:hypothetical protein
MRFFHRGPAGTFANRAVWTGLRDSTRWPECLAGRLQQRRSSRILCCEADGTRPQRKSLLRNNGDGTFTDVTAASGLARPANQLHQTAVWTDVNNDGFIDLFVGNEDTPAQLFVNRRNGTFEDTHTARAWIRPRSAKA